MSTLPTPQVSALPTRSRPTEQVADVQTDVEAVKVSSPVSTRPIRGTTVRLAVPIDAITTSVNTTHKLTRRDSLDRREAFLKGKEGSRQRRRWENDRLLSNPWAEPPLPSDWEVRPTYPTRSVPYYLAPLWDAAEFQRAIESKLKGRKNSTRSRGRNAGMSPMEEAATSIPKEVRAKLKRAKAAKGLLQDLEEDIRRFVKDWNEREAKLVDQTIHNDVPLVSDGEEDEEIVFVGRNGTMSDDTPEKKKHGHSKEKLEDWDEDTIRSREKLVFEGLDGDKGAAFVRWLVHCVGDYYGLRTWSVTTEREVEGQKERRREAYVGVDRRARGFVGRRVEPGWELELPRPLWGMV